MARHGVAHEHPGSAQAVLSAASPRVIFKIPDNSTDDTLNDSSKTAIAIAANAGLLNLKRAYRHAGKFEARHREHGLHLWYTAETTNASHTRLVLLQMRTMPTVSIVSIEPQTAVVDFVPNDPGYSAYQAPYLKFIDMERAWNLQRSSSKVIQIVDSGIYTQSAELNDSIWTNSGEICNNGVDDDDNGYVDDCHGYNFFHDNADIFGNAHEISGAFALAAIGSSAVFMMLSLFSSHDCPPFIFFAVAHGHEVASIAAAKLNNAFGISGIAGGVKIMPSVIFGNWNNALAAFNIREAIVYAKDNGADISCNSWHYINGATDPSILVAIQYFLAEGNTVIIAAAGNEGDALTLTRARNDVLLCC